jgi:hypothetical protein
MISLNYRGFETDSRRKRPVGLLFAGSSVSTIANPIVSVMRAFGVMIDTQ